MFIKEMSDKLKIRKNEIIFFKTNRYEFSKDIQLMRKKINILFKINQYFLNIFSEIDIIIFENIINHKKYIMNFLIKIGNIMQNKLIYIINMIILK